MSALETEIVNGYYVTVEVDDGPESPRESYTVGTQMVLQERGYTLPNDANIDIDSFDSWAEIAAELRENHDALYIAAVVGGDFNEMTMGVVTLMNDSELETLKPLLGLVYVTTDTWQETQGSEYCANVADEKLALAMCAAEVEDYRSYVNGNVLGFVIADRDCEKCRKVVQSCWGFYDSISGVMSEARHEAMALEPGPVKTDEQETSNTK